jgi:hypothetical protein
MRADHSCPQRRHVYHVTTQVLSAAGSTGRPHFGHAMVAVADKLSNIQTCGATIVPPLIGGQADLEDSTGKRNVRIPSRNGRKSAPRRTPPACECTNLAAKRVWSYLRLLARLMPQVEVRPCTIAGCPSGRVPRCLLHACFASRF